ncbi:hypothetical protein D3C81_2227080 [compost metagenome]
MGSLQRRIVAVESIPDSGASGWIGHLMLAANQFHFLGFQRFLSQSAKGPTRDGLMKTAGSAEPETRDVFTLLDVS